MKNIWGFKLERVFKKFFKTFETKYQLETNYNFYPILFVITSKFVNYIMKLVHQVFLKVKLAPRTN
jgi:hypothetical protein